MVSFGTSGHRGSASKNSFNENHIKAMAQAVAEFHLQKGVSKLFLGMDTHALSISAHRTILLIWYLLERQDIEEVLQKIVLMKII